MNLDLVKKIADAVLYEGYILYPYRASAVKNRQRFNWGVITPPSYSEVQRGTERWQMQTEVIVCANEDAEIDVQLRFLHLSEREISQFDEVTSKFYPVTVLELEGKIWRPWQEAVEREVNVFKLQLRGLNNQSQSVKFSFPASCENQPLCNQSQQTIGSVVRRQEPLEGEIRFQISDYGFRLDESEQRKVFKLTIQVSNLIGFEQAEQKSRDEALACSLVSAHTILSIKNGEFVSLLEPPEDLSEAVATCENIGTYPVLVGTAGDRDCMLSSPIILYDYPEIAAESPGDLFDGGEIDEILTLRILTMTDEEKREMLSIDAQARKILERSENLTAEQFMKMHGVLRSS